MSSPPRQETLASQVEKNITQTTPVNPSKVETETMDSTSTHNTNTRKNTLRKVEDLNFQVFSTKELPKGTEIQNYLILGSLGGGGFGITYLARDQFLNRHIVLKENFPNSCAHRDAITARVVPNNRYDMENYNGALRAFLNEARTLANLDHPCIVRVLSIFESNDTAYYAMDFIDGVSLETLCDIQHQKAPADRFSETDLLGLLWKMLDVLMYLHELNICHRDIKPGNILINHEGEPVLIDFGSARNSNSKEQTDTVIASHGFSSPEQSLGLKQTGAWSDLYSLGATFFNLLMGRAPERSESRIITDTEISLTDQPELKARYSHGFLRTIDKALDPRIDKRYRSSAEWLKDLPLSTTHMHSPLPLTEEDFKAEVKSHSVTSSIPTYSRRRIIPNAAAVYIPIERKKSKALRIATFCSYLFPLIVIFFFIDFNDIIDKKQKQPQKTEENVALEKNINLNNIPIPKLSFSDDTPLSSTTINSCKIRLDNQYLRGESMMSPLPETVTLSAISLKKGDNPTSQTNLKEKLTMIIYNEHGTPIASSSNAIFVANQALNSDLRFVFASCPPLKTNQSYKAQFINEQGQASPINISLVYNHSLDAENGTPFATYYCYPKGSLKNLMLTPLAKEITIQLSSNNPDIRKVIRNKNSLPILTELAHMGNIWANYILYEMYQEGKGTSPNPERAYIYLFRAGEAGCVLAENILANLHSPSSRIFPDFKQLPTSVKPDGSIALRYLRYQSQQGNALASILLSTHYAQGWGVRSSKEQAKAIYKQLANTPAATSLHALEAQANILGIWTPYFLKAYNKESLRISCNLANQNISSISGIRLHSITQNNDCVFSNIRVCYKGSTIYTHPENILLKPQEQSQDVPLIIPAHYHDIPAKDFSIDFFASTKNEGVGAVELLKKEMEKPKDTPSSGANNILQPHISLSPDN